MASSGRRLVSIVTLPWAVLQAFIFLTLAAVWLWAFALLWTYMVIDLPKDLGPYSQMSSFSMFLHRAFPMRETNDVSFEYNFQHILMMACVIAVLMMGWTASRSEIEEKADKDMAKQHKKALKAKVKKGT